MLKLNKKVFFAVMMAAILAPLAAQALDNPFELRVGFCDLRNGSTCATKVDPYSATHKSEIAQYVNPDSKNYIGVCEEKAISATRAALGVALSQDDDYIQAMKDVQADCAKSTAVAKPTLEVTIAVDYNINIGTRLRPELKHIPQGIVMFAKLADKAGNTSANLEIGGSLKEDHPTYVSIAEDLKNENCPSVKSFVDDKIDADAVAARVVNYLKDLDTSCKNSSDHNATAQDLKSQISDNIAPRQERAVRGEKSSVGAAL